ncbi:MAG: hypothetical protein CMJ46_05420 [Planctomyces sp.]|nr:hypothetical protein [Planctomyces sp.]
MGKALFNMNESAIVPESNENAADVRFRLRSKPRPDPLELTINPSGKRRGETIWIRNPNFVIGRKHGDLRIGIDQSISARHVRISYSANRVGTGWGLFDLGSRNGTFARAENFVLDGNAEFYVGQNRFRFVVSHSYSLPADGENPDSMLSDSTIALSQPPAVEYAAWLIQMQGSMEGTRILLTENEYHIGGNRRTLQIHPGTGFHDKNCIQIVRNTGNLWCIERNHSSLGLWRRVSRFAVNRPVQFKIGSHSFLIRPARG